MRAVILAAVVAFVPARVARAEEEPLDPLPVVTGAAFQNHLLTKSWNSKGERLRSRPMDQKAVELDAQWQAGDESTLPVAGRDGRVVFRFGSPVKLICAPLRVCSVELQAGEYVTNTPHAGDDTRWDITPLTFGTPPRTLIAIKPTAANLSSNVIVGTNLRAYHIALESPEREDAPFTERVSFTYPDDQAAKWRAYAQSVGTAESAKPAPTREAAGDGAMDLSAVNTNYEINKRGRWMVRRRIRWAPLRAWDNGKKTVIEMPYEITSHELPVLLVCADNDKDCNGDGDGKIANYRALGNRFYVDRLFENAVLIKGVGRSEQERVSINRIRED